MSDSFIYQNGRVVLEIFSRKIGTKGITIELVGGDQPHIGAVAVSQIRSSLKNTDEVSASTSVITCLGHLEDDLAREMAGRIAKKLKRDTVVICGIHLDEISNQEIQEIIQAAQILEEKIILQIEKEEKNRIQDKLA